MMANGLQLGVLRDIYCGQNVAELKQWNCLEKSYTFYCCAYLENEEPRYRVYEKEIESYQFLQDAWLHGQYPTLFFSETHRLQVASGMETTIKQARKLQTAQHLRAYMPKELLEGLHAAEQLPSSGAADDLIGNWWDAVQGIFQPEILQLLQGAAELAIIQKTLSQTMYQKLLGWLQRMQQQMEDLPKPSGILKRRMSGFAYLNTMQKWNYFFDAQPLITIKKQQEYQSRGIVTTPVWQKEYRYQKEGELPQIRRAFAKELELRMDSQYLQAIQRLWQLPSGVGQQWQEQYLVQTEPWSVLAKNTEQFYIHMWHLQKKNLEK